VKSMPHRNLFAHAESLKLVARRGNDAELKPLTSHESDLTAKEPKRYGLRHNVQQLRTHRLDDGEILHDWDGIHHFHT
jgi:hypothetical protein